MPQKTIKLLNNLYSTGYADAKGWDYDGISVDEANQALASLLLGLPEMRVSGEHDERLRVLAIRGAIAEVLGVKEASQEAEGV